MEYIKKNIASGGKVYLLGGKGAVSSSVQSEVKTIGKRTDRISGANRYDTSVAVAKKFSEKQEKDIVIANGDDFPDGLVGGPLAYFMKSPLILINERNTVSAAGFAKEYESERMVILGGTSLITDVMADNIIHVVWVIDKPAWDEVVDDKSKPIYEIVQTWWTFVNGTKKYGTQKKRPTMPILTIQLVNMAHEELVRWRRN